MAKNILQFKLLLMSPGDVTDERNAASELINSWNAQIGNALGVSIDLVKWETHSQPLVGANPQKILNQQLVSEADFGIAIFWSRLGTPTDTHISGTAEEIDGLIARGIDVSIYICNRPIEQSKIQEYTKLSDYLAIIKRNALITNYTNLEDLRELLLLHITHTIINLVSKEKAININNLDNTSTSKNINKPNIKIKLQAGFVPTGAINKGYLEVCIQNHSDSYVFIGGVMLTMKNGNNIFYQRDAITQALNNRKELRPSEALSFHFDPIQIKSDIPDLSQIKGFTVKDDIDRIFSSDEENVGSLIESLLNFS
ncbi:MAG: hypothetical protein II007_15610 [Gammaproteobacteria bacterium]|nr:hypothetical protein [Gammaproteobacteria bacterium]